jgi:hypothetical protein
MIDMSGENSPSIANLPDRIDRAIARYFFFSLVMSINAILARGDDCRRGYYRQLERDPAGDTRWSISLA